MLTGKAGELRGEQRTDVPREIVFRERFGDEGKDFAEVQIGQDPVGVTRSPGGGAFDRPGLQVSQSLGLGPHAHAAVLVGAMLEEIFG